MQLAGRQVLLELISKDDAPALEWILKDPDVATWWGPPSDPLQRNDIFDSEFSTTLSIQIGQKTVGLISFHEETSSACRHAGMDIVIHSDYQGQGIGGDALRTLARFLFSERGHHRITIDPVVENTRAIAAYRRIGFQPVGVMRSYERVGNGPWRDALLMDLLSGELVA